MNQPPYFMQGSLGSGDSIQGPIGGTNASQYRLPVRYGKITGLADAGSSSLMPSYYFEEFYPQGGGTYLDPTSENQNGVAYAVSTPSGFTPTGPLYEQNFNADVPVDGSVTVPILPRFTKNSDGLDEWYFSYTNPAGTNSIDVEATDAGGTTGPFTTSTLNIIPAAAAAVGGGQTDVTIDDATGSQSGIVNLTTQTLGDGDKTFQADVVVEGSVTIDIDLHVMGDAQIDGDATVNGSLHVLTDAEIDGIASIGPLSGMGAAVVYLNVFGGSAVSPPSGSQSTIDVNGGIQLNELLSFVQATSIGGVGIGTLTNAPSAGDPNFWLAVEINGNQYAIPCW